LDRASRCSPGEATGSTTSGSTTLNESYASSRGEGSRAGLLEPRSSSLRPPSPISERHRSASPVYSRNLSTASSPAVMQASIFRRRSVGNATLSLQPVPHEARSWCAVSNPPSPGPSPTTSFRRVVEEEDPSATQETQFGGREAAQVQVGGGEPATVDGRDTPAFTHSESAALTFHPQFHPRQDGRRESKRLPGQVPWTAFMFSSFVLVLVWLMGFFFYAIHPLASNDAMPKSTSSSADASLDEESNASSLTGGHVFLSAHHWSGHSMPVRPVGFTCTADGLAFVAEQYRVHQIRLDIPSQRWEGQGAQFSEVLERCLSQQPEFHSSGLASISLECSSRRDGCTAILLSAPGRHVLYCPLAMIDAGNKNTSSDTLQRRPKLQGMAPLIKLDERLTTVAGFLHEADGSRRWWGSAALGQQHSQRPVQLQVQFGARFGPRAFPLNDISLQHQFSVPVGKAHPQSVEPSPTFLGTAVNRSWQAESLKIASADSKQLEIKSLHVHEQTGLLGLATNGKILHAWGVAPRKRSDSKRNSARAPPLHKLVPVGSWRLPAGSRWSGICTSKNYLYALGHTVAGDGQDPTSQTAGRGVPEVWRFDLPDSISKLGSMADSFV